MKKAVITGPESTWKSTLSKQLAAYYDLMFVPEVARRFLEVLGRPYKQSDLVDIAREQLRAEEVVGNTTPEILLSDTDLLTIKIWSEYKYGSCDPWITEQLAKHLPDVYLICSPDVPWEPDPLRENPHDREQLFEVYLSEIKVLEVPCTLISGTSENRVQQAIKAIDVLKK